MNEYEFKISYFYKEFETVKTIAENNKIAIEKVLNKITDIDKENVIGINIIYQRDDI